jgi:ankyrin repeat protein
MQLISTKGLVMKKVTLLLIIIVNTTMSMRLIVTPEQKTLNQNLFKNIIQNNIEGVKEGLKKGADISKSNIIWHQSDTGRRANSPLAEAIEFGNLHIAKILIDAGAIVEKRTLADLIYNDNLEAVKMLLSAPQFTSIEKENMLLEAVTRNKIQMVKMLLDAGVPTKGFKDFVLRQSSIDKDIINLLKEPRGANALQIVNKEHYNQKVIPADVYKEIGSHNLEDID